MKAEERGVTPSMHQRLAGSFAPQVGVRAARANASDEWVAARSALGKIAVRALGEDDRTGVVRYLLPNSLAPIIVQTSLRMATVLLTASGLSFLGLGVQPPSPEWGAMLSNARTYMITAPHVATVPGLAIMLVVLGFNLLGDGLRDALDPRLRE
jgi:ABC-type antimicrobial peptide transport system permease subunit